MIFCYTVDNGPNAKGVARPEGISRLKQIIPQFRKPSGRQEPVQQITVNGKP